MLRHASKMILGQGLRFPSMPAVTVGAGTPRMYHERVVDHYSNPRNVRSFDKNDPNVGTRLVGDPACGDVMKLQIESMRRTEKLLMLPSRRLAAVLQLLPPLLVSLSATEWVKGKQMEEVLSIKNTEIAKHLSLPPVKLHCSMLVEDAIKAAVKDYESKRAKSNASEEAAPVEKAAMLDDVFVTTTPM